MRCLTLARLFKSIGVASEFATKPYEGSCYKLIEQKGYKTHLIPTDLSEEEDSLFVKKIIAQEVTTLVVDNYNLSRKWENELYSLCRITAIDDLKREHQSHFLLDNNFRLEYASAYRGKVPETCQLFLGPKYSLLRPEFTSAPKNQNKNNNILVFFGGGDHSGETLAFIKQLTKSESSLNWHVLVSASNKYLNQIKPLDLNSNIQLHIDPPSVPKLMGECSYYLGSGGSITWERLYLGLTGSVVSIADNQEELSNNLMIGGYQNYLGICDKQKFSNYIQHVETALYSQQTQEMREKSKELVHSINQDTLKQIIGIQ